MDFLSTRGDSPPVDLSTAINQGLAPDGGLYVPRAFPSLNGADVHPDLSMSEVGTRIASAFAPQVEGDVLAEICQDALNFPIPRKKVDGGTEILELFHGPTAAFKDVGARFLAAFLTHPALASKMERSAPTRTILVATSGDTGGAVASAFWRRPGVRVILLYPKNGVSPRQAHQLAAWGENVQTYAVNGTFDQCQEMVKKAFVDDDLRRDWFLSSANSINVGRLVPQSFYYAHTALQVARERGEAVTFVIPSGNLGNATAALWARALGFPIAGVALATNANRVFVDFLEKGAFEPAPSIPTLANAMDVGNPSNLERIQHLFPNHVELGKVVRAMSVDDDAIRSTISAFHQKHRWPLCPHTATAIHVREALDLEHAVVVATAHPAKFESVVEDLIHESLPLPPALAEVLARPARQENLAPTLDALRAALKK
jgi:threonine synthase